MIGDSHVCQSSFRDGPKDQTPDVQLHIWGSRCARPDFILIGSVLETITCQVKSGNDVSIDGGR
jgi:hypothetical protein